MLLADLIPSWIEVRISISLILLISVNSFRPGSPNFNPSLPKLSIENKF